MNPAMNTSTFTLDRPGRRRAAAEEIGGLVLGAGFTFALFLGMAHFENSGPAEPVVAIEDLRMAALPFEPPPPPPQREQQVPAPDEGVPLAGLEIGRSDSPVAIAVVPPDLETLVPAMTLAPKARIQFAQLHAELKPKAGLEVDVHHVYQSAEVDQKPHAIVRTAPIIPSDVSGSAASLRVGLLLLIDVNGKPESVRVVETSGNAQFDALVASTVQREWLFSPGIRRGQKVRVLAQQAFRINFGGSSSPFNLN